MWPRICEISPGIIGSITDLPYIQGQKLPKSYPFRKTAHSSVALSVLDFTPAQRSSRSMKARIWVSALFGVHLHKILRRLVSFCLKAYFSVKNYVFNCLLAYFETKNRFQSVSDCRRFSGPQIYCFRCFQLILSVFSHMVVF